MGWLGGWFLIGWRPPRLIAWGVAGLVIDSSSWDGASYSLDLGGREDVQLDWVLLWSSMIRGVGVKVV